MPNFVLVERIRLESIRLEDGTQVIEFIEMMVEFTADDMR